MTAAVRGGIGGRLADFAKRRVLLVGDTIVDRNTYGVALGLSVETPTVVARPQTEIRTLGGAAFVCRNLLELGASVDFITAVGGDAEAAHVRAFSSPRLDLIAVDEPGRPTTVKHRFWVDGYKLLQLEAGSDAPMGEAAAETVLSAFHARLPGADIVVVSDYRHGLISPGMARTLVFSATAAGKPIYVDSQIAQASGNHTDYGPGAIFCLNLKEARSVDPAFAPSEDPVAFSELQQRLGARALVVKLGERGSMLFDGSTVVSARAAKVEPVDTTGAGDAFLACLALAGLDAPLEALTLANRWAALSVGIAGTGTPALADLAASEDDASDAGQR